MFLFKYSIGVVHFPLRNAWGGNDLDVALRMKILAPLMLILSARKLVAFALHCYQWNCGC